MTSIPTNPTGHWLNPCGVPRVNSWGRKHIKRRLTTVISAWHRGAAYVVIFGQPWPKEGGL